MGSKITNASGGALTLYKDAASNTINASDLYNKVVNLKGRFLLAQSYYYNSGYPIMASCILPVDAFCTAYENLQSGYSVRFKMPSQGNADVDFFINKNGKITCANSNINFYLV
jgi:hypothetical protein